MKRLFNFTIAKEEQVERDETSKNEAGEDVIVKKKETISIPKTFFLRKPTRSLTDEAALFYGREYNNGIKNGLMTIPLLEKHNSNNGGIFSDAESERYANLYKELFKKQEELEKNKVENKDIGSLAAEIVLIQKQLQEFESFKWNVYAHTAEIRARNLSITWWILNLSYKDENGKEEPFFAGNSYEEKIKSYDAYLETDDLFVRKVLDKFLAAVSFWVINRSEKQEDFDELEKILAKDAANTAK